MFVETGRQMFAVIIRFCHNSCLITYWISMQSNITNLLNKTRESMASAEIIFLTDNLADV